MDGSQAAPAVPLRLEQTEHRLDQRRLAGAIRPADGSWRRSRFLCLTRWIPGSRYRIGELGGITPPMNAADCLSRKRRGWIAAMVALGLLALGVVSAAARSDVS